VNLLANEGKEVIIVIVCEKLLSRDFLDLERKISTRGAASGIWVGDLWLEFPDSDKTGRRASILSEADVDATRIDVNVEIEAKTAAEKEKPFSPVDGSGFAYTKDEGRCRMSRRKADSAAF
jgi:hypothetical protein